MEKETVLEINVQVPEDIARSLGSSVGDVERAVLEGLALESVRAGRLSRGQVRRLLGFQTRFEVDGFLREHGVTIQENLDSVLRDSESILQSAR
jgi:Uncharacterised protein family (UPF0175)